MTRLRMSALFVAIVIVISAKSISIGALTTAQTVPSATSKSATISLSIAVPNKQIPMGQKPWVHLTVTNLGSEEIAYPRDRVYVEGPNGEPQLHISRVRSRIDSSQGSPGFVQPDFDRTSHLKNGLDTPLP